MLQLTSDLATGLISSVLGVVYLYMTFRLPDVSIGDPLGPRLFPLIVGIGAVISGAVLLAKEIRAGKTRSAQAPKGEDAPDYSSRKGTYRKIGLTLLAGIIFGLLLDQVGYLISSFVFMMTLMCLVNKLKRLAENIVIALGFSVVTYVVFAILFKVSLPRGILAF